MQTCTVGSSQLAFARPALSRTRKGSDYVNVLVLAMWAACVVSLTPLGSFGLVAWFGIGVLPTTVPCNRVVRALHGFFPRRFTKCLLSSYQKPCFTFQYPGVANWTDLWFPAPTPLPFPSPTLELLEHRLPRATIPDSRTGFGRTCPY